MQDVIVENRKTGERKEMTRLMAKNLELKYRIVEDAKTTAKNPNFTPPIEKKTELELLQEEYANIFGNKPHHRLGVDKLKALIQDTKK